MQRLAWLMGQLEAAAAWLMGVGKLNGAILAGSLATGLLTAFKIRKEVLDYRRAAHERGTAEKARRMAARQSFTEADLAAARKYFVELSCSNLDPTKELDLRGALGVREPVLQAIAREMAGARSRHLLVLADSGMGKTTLLLNLLRADLELPVDRRQNMVLITLARDDSIERIRAVSDKTDKILLLDAFDEDAEAIDDHKGRLTEIMRAARDFRALVLTCRTQFFAHDEEIPHEVGVLRIGAREAGVDHSFSFRKIYLLPYDKDQEKRYLNKAIPLWQPRARRKARALASRIGDLAARPMLLALVPELVRTNTDVREVFQLYNFMVESWFYRERAWISRDALFEASKLLALNMVTNRHARGAESLSAAEFAQVIRPLSVPKEAWPLESRSLLNRDSGGRLKFSHRSIMEYFFVVAVIEGHQEGLGVAWTDQMREFLLSWGRCAGSQEDHDKAMQLLSQDLGATGVFPLLGGSRGDEGGEITADDLHACLQLPVPRSVAQGFPRTWSGCTLKIAGTNQLHLVRELADGLSWDVPRVPRSKPQGSQRPYFNYDDVYGDGSSTAARNLFPWRVSYPRRLEDREGPRAQGPTLDEFVSLAVLLAGAGRLQRVLDEDELYWLANRQGRQARFLINVRAADADEQAQEHAAGASKVESAVWPGPAGSVVFTLYTSTSPDTKAVLIETCRDRMAGVSMDGREPWGPHS